MKTLLVMRHAKSSWDNESLADFDRPLNDRGLRNAPDMAQRIINNDVEIDLIVHSPALRTTQTAEILKKSLKLSPQIIIPFDELYLADPDVLLATAQSLPNESDTVMLIGHNPGVTEFVNMLCDEQIPNIVTAGLAYIQFEVEEWINIQYHYGKLLDYDYPKRK